MSFQISNGAEFWNIANHKEVLEELGGVLDFEANLVFLSRDVVAIVDVSVKNEV